MQVTLKWSKISKESVIGWNRHLKTEVHIDRKENRERKRSLFSRCRPTFSSRCRQISLVHLFRSSILSPFLSHFHGDNILLKLLWLSAASLETSTSFFFFLLSSVLHFSCIFFSLNVQVCQLDLQNTPEDIE